MDFELYHDESKVNGYWHGMLLVPQARKTWLVDLLEEARANAGYTDPLGIKVVRKDNRVFDCAKAWITIGVAAMKSKSGGQPVPIYLGKKMAHVPEYRLLHEAVGAKFILFRDRNAHQNMTLHPDHASKVETTFRIALKGGLHFLGNETESIWIERIHFDGYEHHKRHIDRARVVGRIRGLRDYCHISDRDDLIDDSSSDHRRSDSQDYEDCHLIQLTDLMLGAFRSVLLGPTNPIHLRMSYPIESLVLRYQKGYPRMRHSRWWSSFCMSQCFLEDGRWKYETFEFQPEYAYRQMSLPNS